MSPGLKGGSKIVIAAVLSAVIVSACASEVPETNAPAPQPASETAAFFSSMSENVEKYRVLIGLKQSRIEAMFDETSEGINDSGIEFKHSGIRIWFDEAHGRAVHVMILSKDVDFNGARIGDSEQAFEDAFEKVIDNHPGSGYKDYGYEDLVLRLYYDAASGKTEAVSLMLEPPEGGGEQ
ncbi:hypothetical protein [Acidaminobacter sp.]|uniref:hypothetical protein n=1 Tax=Acidaminobacter sp. TaxID=1872102 RepID=UPI001381C167|nr:hypothetical protein [Acidaminobacter sp.]MDK9710104.1 hypothetical protein [Acidaminobacter sp.]MZQ98409.1 hypothetical protein [Acidaminobacter sp.]